MLVMFEPQGPKRLTGLVTGDDTFISFFYMPSGKYCVDRLTGVVTGDDTFISFFCMPSGKYGVDRLTGVVTGDETFISFFACHQANIMRIDEAGDRPVVTRPGFQSKSRLFTILFPSEDGMRLPIWRGN